MIYITRKNFGKILRVGKLCNKTAGTNIFKNGDDTSFPKEKKLLKYKIKLNISFSIAYE